MNICLCKMTKELARAYFREFVVDPALFMDNQEYQPYIYSEEKADSTVERYQNMGRIYLAVMLNDTPIGEVVLKNIDWSEKHCTLGICLRSDDVKNKGYGTQAEVLTLRYTFGELGMETVYADTITKNTRSQHVLMKVGFVETHRDDSFIYYRCNKDQWNEPRNHVSVLFKDIIA